MRQDVAVKHELADNDWISERDQNLHRALDGKIDDILIANERYWLAIKLGHLKIELVNVKDVLLVGDVLNRPLLDRAERNWGIDPIRIELLAIDEELIGIGILREYESALFGNRL